MHPSGGCSLSSNLGTPTRGVYMNTIYQRFIIALLILVGGWLVFQFPASTIRIGDAKLQVKIVDTDVLREKGLSLRASLEKNKGMLFVFEKPGTYGFWMKDMNFAIDIIWIGQDKKVIEITNNVMPDTFPKTFYAKEPIQYVLEVNAGWAERNAVEPGDIFKGP